MVAAAFLSVALPIRGSASSADLAIHTGQSIVVQTPGLTRVAVGDGKVAGIVPIGTSEIVVNGKAAGNTTLFVWTNAGRRDFVVTVTEQALDDLRRMVQSAILIPGLHVDQFANSIVVRRKRLQRRRSCTNLGHRRALRAARRNEQIFPSSMR